MIEVIRSFVEDETFNELYEQLIKSHNPIKADISDEHLQAIGFLVVRFQRLETTIRRFLMCVFGLASRQIDFDMLVNKLSFRNLVTTFKAFMKDNNSSRCDDVVRLLNKALTAGDMRNNIIHSIHFSEKAMKIRLGKKSLMIEKEDIVKIAEVINELDTAIEALKFDYTKPTS